MKTLLTLTLKSLRNRKTTAALTIASIAISIALLLGVERIRTEAQNSFTHTVSGTDVIVGARSSSLNLLLYSVFHMGNATNNVTWQTYQELAADDNVAWTIPIALGDSHKGHRVIGTTDAIFSDYRYGDEQPLQLAEGAAFAGVYDAVLGSAVAKKLGYTLNQAITLSHGMEAKTLQSHDDKPFTVRGILAPTGTPMDQAILTSLEGIEALHIDWRAGSAPLRGLSISAERAAKMNLQPKSVTAFFVGLDSPIAAFHFQRRVNDYKAEALTGILPGIALMELWQLVGSAQNALLAISVMVVVSGLLGMLTTILTSLNERRREVAILRSVGARPRFIFALMMTESFVYAVLGSALGVVILYALLIIFQPLFQQTLGLHFAIAPLAGFEVLLIGAIIATATVLGIIPARRAYKNALTDGLTIKL